MVTVTILLYFLNHVEMFVQRVSQDRYNPNNKNNNLWARPVVSYWAPNHLPSRPQFIEADICGTF